MAKGPYIPWFPKDITGDTALQMVSLAAFGLWHKLLYIMHEGDPYGHLAIKGQVIPRVKLARMCGCSEGELQTLLEELEGNDIFSRTKDGIIYSRRMVRDQERSQRARVNGARGGNPKLRGTVGPGSPSSPLDNQEDNQYNKGEDKRSLGIGIGYGNRTGIGKEEGSGEEPIPLPYRSPEFERAWVQWCEGLAERGCMYQTRQQASDAVDVLAKYDEAFAIELLRKATRSRWKDFHFPNTPELYARTLAERGHADRAPREERAPAASKSRRTIQDRNEAPESLKDFLASTDQPPTP